MVLDKPIKTLGRHPVRPGSAGRSAA
ncbi:hypothetical protein [Dongia sp.]